MCVPPWRSVSTRELVSSPATSLMPNRLAYSVMNWTEAACLPASVAMARAAAGRSSAVPDEAARTKRAEPVALSMVTIELAPVARDRRAMASRWPAISAAWAEQARPTEAASRDNCK